MTKKPEPAKDRGAKPTRDEVEAEVPGAKPTDAEERRAKYERDRRGLEPDEETC
jgi:hypothetical protein